MKRAKKTMLIIALALLIGIIFIRHIFAETSLSAMARCTVPQFVTMANGDTVLVGSGEVIKKGTTTTETQTEEQEKEESYIAENNTNLIEQKEEVVSEDTKEVKLITTVCAK